MKKVKIPCYVYVIKEVESNYYKIGNAYCPERRLGQLSCANPRKLIIVNKYCYPDKKRAEEVEFKAQCLVMKHWVNNEWFLLENNEIEKVIKLLTETSKRYKVMLKTNLKDIYDNAHPRGEIAVTKGE